MAGWRTHLTLGFLVWAALVAFWFFNAGLAGLFEFSVLGAVVSIVGSLAPDVDTHKSKLGFYAHAGVFGAALAAGAVLSAGRPAVDFLLSTIAIAFLAMLAFSLVKPRHRGITHTLRAAAVYAGAVFAAGYFLAGLATAAYLAIAGFFCYCSHLVLDGWIRF
jgi:membrane-bound metal-dependent hydrolase YbcI (DUF457 family)